MSTRAQLLEAMEALRQGRFDEAERLSRAILQSERNNPDAWHFLGIAAKERGDLVSARDHIVRAIKSHSGNPDFHFNLANVQRQLGENEAAEKNYRKALQLNPGVALYHFGLGSCLAALGRAPESIEFLERASASGGHPEALPLLVESMLRSGHFSRAQERWTDLTKEGRTELILGASQKELGCGRAARSREIVEFGFSHFPDSPGLWNEMGNVLLESVDYAAAETAYRRALAIDPENGGIHYNLGKLLQETMRLEEARISYVHALALGAERGRVENNLAQVEILLGEWPSGWRRFENRWFDKSKPKFPAPQWTGESLQGRRVLVYPEQGFGDTLQFCRYLPLLANAGATVLFAAPEPLREVLGSLEGVAQWVGSRDVVQTDFVIPMLSLPGAFGTTVDSVPASIPYLPWSERKKLPGAGGVQKVGLVWKGSPKHPRTRFRDIPFAEMERLSAMPGFQFYSFQAGEKWSGNTAVIDLGPRLKDFSLAADFISQIDLLISVDTAYAHLAGAMGKRVWLLLPYFPDYRWLVGRSDTPWYPQFRLFRQSRPLEWGDVLEQVRKELVPGLQVR